MKKTKGKVLSLILAGALIVSSFSSLNFASAASSRETGKLDFGDTDEIYLVSKDSKSDPVDLTELVGKISLDTYDHEDASDVEFASYTHASGDRLVNVNSDGELTVKANVSGEEVITVTYKGEYDRDDDRTVSVRGSKDITIHADEVGKDFVAEYTKDVSGRPDDYEAAAVNDQYLQLGVYQATAKDTSGAGAIEAKYAASTTTYTKSGTGDNAALTVLDSGKLELKDDDVFTDVYVNGLTTKSEVGPVSVTDPTDPGQTIPENKIILKTTFVPTSGDDKYEIADTGTDTLKVKLAGDSSKTDFKVEVAKKWNADADLTTGLDTDSASTFEINKKGGKTYIAKSGIDWDDNWSNSKEDAQAVSGYEIEANGTVTVKAGSVGKITAKNITVEDGTTGDLKAETISVEDGSVGTIKVKDKDVDTDTRSIDVSDGKVKAIDAEDAEIDITGGNISGDVKGDTISIDSEDEDVPTTIGGTVEAKGEDKEITISSSSDADVEVNVLKGAVTASDENVTIKTINADYDNETIFDGFTGKVDTLTGTDGQDVTLEGDSKVTLSKKLVAENVSIDDDAKLTIPEGTIGSVDGAGTLAVPAGKLFIEDSFDEATLQLTEGLVAGATAFQTYTNQVDVDDVTTLGYSLEQKVANDDTDKFVIKDITFAGLAFDKTNVSVAKGYDTTLTVANYPDGTALPADAQIEWDIDANDDYFQMTVEGNTATIKVLDYSTDYASDNKATVTATVVDANGNVLTDEDGNDYVEATANLTATALPQSKLTLDTKSVTIGTGNIYQFLAKSSTDAAITAASSDTQIATVDEINPNDPRGHKFQINAVAEGKATITVTDANGATGAIAVTVAKVNGTLKADTTSYTMAPGNIYDVKFSVTGTTATPVVTCNGKVVSVAPRGNGVYRITGVTPGTAYVQATVGATHVTVTVKVVAGAAASGVKGNNVSVLK